MDGEGSRIPVLWDDRGEVANTFDVDIFSNFSNLEGFQFRLGGHPVLDDVLGEDDRRFFHERVLLTARPSHAAAPCEARWSRTSCSSGCHQRLKLSFLCHGRPHSRLALPWPFCPQGGWISQCSSDAKHAVIRPAQLPSVRRGVSSAKSIHSCCVAVSVPTNVCTTDTS